MPSLAGCSIRTEASRGMLRRAPSQRWSCPRPVARPLALAGRESPGLHAGHRRACARARQFLHPVPPPGPSEGPWRRAPRLVEPSERRSTRPLDMGGADRGGRTAAGRATPRRSRRAHRRDRHEIARRLARNRYGSPRRWGTRGGQADEDSAPPRGNAGEQDRGRGRGRAAGRATPHRCPASALRVGPDARGRPGGAMCRPRRTHCGFARCGSTSSQPPRPCLAASKPARGVRPVPPRGLLMAFAGTHSLSTWEGGGRVPSHLHAGQPSQAPATCRPGPLGDCQHAGPADRLSNPGGSSRTEEVGGLGHDDPLAWAAPRRRPG